MMMMMMVINYYDMLLPIFVSLLATSRMMWKAKTVVRANAVIPLPLARQPEPVGPTKR